MMHRVGSKTGKLLLEAGNEKRVYYRSLFYSVYSWQILLIYLFILVFIFECVLQNNDFNNILAK